MGSADGDRNRHVSFPERFLATGLCSGYVSWAPGTAGSIVGLILWSLAGIRDPLTGLLLIAPVFFVGAYVSGKVAAATPDLHPPVFRKNPSTHPDPGIIVIDEIVGMWTALYALPLSWTSAVAAFVLFRVMDIFKPFPARQLERLQGGWGIMLDDVAAGIYANIACRVLLMFISQGVL
jgi:phosphatidylglycerophosphatase A